MWFLFIACSTSPAPDSSVPADPAPAPIPAPVREQAAGSIGGAPILEEPVLVGALARSAVDAALMAAAEPVRACWAPIRATHPRGKVLVKLVVSPDGKVRRTQMRSTTLRHAPTENCVLSVLSDIDFGAFEGSEVSVLTAPFVFP